MIKINEEWLKYIASIDDLDKLRYRLAVAEYALMTACREIGAITNGTEEEIQNEYDTYLKMAEEDLHNYAAARELED